MKSNWCLKRLGALAVICSAFGLVAPANAQDNRKKESEKQTDVLTVEDADEEFNKTIAFPARESMIELTAKGPAKVRSGQTFEYEVHVTNTSDTHSLHHVTIAQANASHFEVQSSNVRSMKQSDKRASADRQNQNQTSRKSKNQSGPAATDSNNSESGQQKKSDDSKQQAQKQNKKGQWKISSLMPGETQVITVQAVSDREGDANVCLFVKSFTPAVCLTTRFVKPELKLTKDVPEKASMCEVIPFVYVVENTGTGNPGAFTVKDELSEGLQTEAGESTLSFKVDGLEPGDKRKFVADIVATKAGEHSSRAVAVEDNGQETQSQRVTTQVTKPDLAIAIRGDEVAYVEETVEYTVLVTNQGDEAADDVSVTLHFPESLTFAWAGDVRDSDEKVNNKQSQGKPQAADPANKSDKQQQGEKASQNQNGQQQKDNNNNNNKENNSNKDSNKDQNVKFATRDWQIQTLGPGQSKQIKVRFNGMDAGKARLKAVAQYICRGSESDQEKKSTPVKSVAQTTTEMISLPALLVAVVDEQDPVKVDGEVVYRITVKNQGTAADHNVQVAATLPESLEYMKASGPTDAKQDGRQISFKPIEKMEPGETVSWTLRAKATGEGDVRFKVELTSESMSKPAKTQEPTMLYQVTSN